MQSRGYGELRYAEIAEAVGIRRASIHHYFPSKRDLGVAVIASYRIGLLQKLSNIDDEAASPRERLDRYVDLYRAVLDEDHEHMCPGGMLAAEVITLPIELQREASEFFADNEAWLVGVLSAAETRGDLRSGSALESARFVIAVLQGALLLARLHRDPERITTAAAELQGTLWREASPRPGLSA
jgi:TetR/AcrR family transcriptional regulator, transcriptional repressor for nem operon